MSSIHQKGYVRRSAKVLTAKLSFKLAEIAKITITAMTWQPNRCKSTRLIWVFYIADLVYSTYRYYNFGCKLSLEKGKLLWKFPLSRKTPFSIVYSLSTPDLEPWILADHRRRFANLCRKCGRSSSPNHTLIGSHYMEM